MSTLLHCFAFTTTTHSVRCSVSDETAKKQPVEVVVTDISIPFQSVVWLLLKFGLAAVPVGIILLILWGVFGGMLAGL